MKHRLLARGRRLWIAGCRFFILSIAYCLLSAVISTASDHIQIEARVSVPVADGNIAKARETAFNDALIKAVEDVIKGGPFQVDIEKSQKILNSKIYSNASSYILNYRVITEELTEESAEGQERPLPIYKVSLDINIALDALNNDLIKFGIIKPVEDDERAINLTISDIFSYKDFFQLKEAFKNLKGVKEIFYRTFSHGRITMAIRCASDIDAIKEELILKDFGSFKIAIISAAEGELDLKIIKKEIN